MSNHNHQEKDSRDTLYRRLLRHQHEAVALSLCSRYTSLKRRNIKTGDLGTSPLGRGLKFYSSNPTSLR